MSALPITQATAGTVAAAPAPLTEQALAQMFGAFALSEEGVTEEFRRVARAGSETFSSLREANQRQSDMIVALTARVQQLEARLAQSEELHRTEITTLTRRVSGVETNATAEITSLRTDLRSGLTSAQQSITTMQTRITTIHQTLSGVQSGLSTLGGKVNQFISAYAWKNYDRGDG